MSGSSTTFFTGEYPLKAVKLNTAFSERVLRSGDTMVGPLILAQDPIVPFGAVTKQYVDTRVVDMSHVAMDDYGSVYLAGGLAQDRAASGVTSWNGRSGDVFIVLSDITGVGGLSSATAAVTYLGISAAAATYLSISSASGMYLPLTGGTLSGNLTLPRDPQAALQAATKQYVDNKVSGAGSGYLPLTGGTVSGPLTVLGALSVGNGNAITTAGIVLCGHLAAGSAGANIGGMIGSWDEVTNGYSGFITDSTGSVVFGTADAGSGTISFVRAVLDTGGNLTTQGYVGANSGGVAYPHIAALGSGAQHQFGFDYSGAGLTVWVDSTYIGFMSTHGTAADEPSVRFAAIEARLSALEGAGP